MTAAALVRTTRREQGITQAELARRLGTSQSAIARLESGRANPTVAGLDRTLRALGRRLELGTGALAALDEAQIRRHLAWTPAQRLRAHDAASRNLARLLSGARRLPREQAG